MGEQLEREHEPPQDSPFAARQLELARSRRPAGFVQIETLRCTYKGELLGFIVQQRRRTKAGSVYRYRVFKTLEDMHAAVGKNLCTSEILLHNKWLPDPWWAIGPDIEDLQLLFDF